MAAEIVRDPALLDLPVEYCPDVEHLVTEDDTPVDNLFSEKQQRLLTEPLYSSWAGPGEGRTFVAMANVGLFYAVRQPPFVPDMLLSLDVELPEDLWPKPHRSYFVWEYGKAPDVVVEIVSGDQGGEDAKKRTGYARVGVRYYAIYDPAQLLSQDVLRAYRLDGLNYRELQEPIWMPDVGLGLRIWQGQYEGHGNDWLRWVDAQGRWIESGAERADRERQRADRIAEQLRRMGIEPEA